MEFEFAIGCCLTAAGAFLLSTLLGARMKEGKDITRPYMICLAWAPAVFFLLTGITILVKVLG